MLSLGIIAALSRSGIQDSLSWIVDNLDQRRIFLLMLVLFSPEDRSPADPLDSADPVSLQLRDGLNSGFPWPRVLLAHARRFGFGHQWPPFLYGIHCALHGSF